MKYLVLFILISYVLVGRAQPQINVKIQFAKAAMQSNVMLSEHSDTTGFPFSVNGDGTLKDMKSSGWCSGFFGGSLWYLYQYTHNERWRNAADKWSRLLIKEQFNTHTHDLGFMLYCSLGNGYRVTGNGDYERALMNAARSLSSRFDPHVGLIKSWDKFGNYTYPVIIDNMMNLELLLWATRKSGDPNFRKIAVSHADRTLQNQFRKDNSCYHVVCYDELGKAVAWKNHQGYRDSSAWSRGQAWATYGYTVMYRETKDPRYLDRAEKSALYFLENPNLPVDLIPYWDFNAPNIPNEERDASAAAVMASALLELSGYTKSRQRYYFNSAEKILISLSGPAYQATAGTNHGFILKHSVSAKVLNAEVDEPLVYADYYYLEALLRYDQLTAVAKRK